MLHVFLTVIICRLYKLTFSEQAQVTLQVRVSVSDLVYSFVDHPSLAGIQKKFFHQDPKPLLVALPTGKF